MPGCLRCKGQRLRFQFWFRFRLRDNLRLCLRLLCHRLRRLFGLPAPFLFLLRLPDFHGIRGDRGLFFLLHTAADVGIVDVVRHLLGEVLRLLGKALHLGGKLVVDFLPGVVLVLFGRFTGSLIHQETLLCSGGLLLGGVSEELRRVFRQGDLVIGLVVLLLVVLLAHPDTSSDRFEPQPLPGHLKHHDARCHRCVQGVDFPAQRKREHKVTFLLDKSSHALALRADN